MYSFPHFKLYPLVCLCVVPFLGAATDHSNTLNLETALARAIESDPELQLYEARLEAAAGQVEQAGLRPNPVLGGEIENVLGSGPYRDTESLELTFGLTQLIETADKRIKRVRLAASDRELVEAERQLRLLELQSAVRLAFIEALLAQKTVELREAQMQLAEQSDEEVARMVEAARSAEVERSRTRLSLGQARFALARVQRDLETAKRQLSLFWDETPEVDYRLEGEIGFEEKAPSMEQLIASLSQSAALHPYELLSQRGQAAVELEQARAKPDFELFGGARYSNEEAGDHSFVIGIETPWPLFDRNQGNIRSAQAELRGVALEREAQRRQMIAQLNRSYQTLIAAQAEAASVERDLLPLAEQTVSETKDSYERGQSTLLNVLESRATLFEFRASYLDALHRYAQAVAQIDALIYPAQ